ncbi:MAG TPA: TerC family protein, partial [Labilithrix sp.]|nr:TerC family protein [Labilithrix sp.]
SKAKGASFVSIMVQIVFLDLVFSLDSVISAIGMAKDLWVMVVAMVVAVGFMGAFSGAVARFIETNPTFKMLGLSFLMMIGVLLFAEGVGTPVNKNYIYAAMVFSLGVEVLNMRARRNADALRRAAT